MENPHSKKLLKSIRALGDMHSVWRVFSDFTEMSALTIANSVDKLRFNERETQYLNTIDKYKPDEQKIFPEMFADLVEALQYELIRSNAPTDILGRLFHELKLHDRFKGQFFTPQNICDLMGAIAFSEQTIGAKGYAELSEPCCGSGATILGFAKAMLQKEYDYCSQLIVTATDKDLNCVYMTYSQLSLYGIPAIIIHGNSLTNEEFSRWYTPVYVINGWKYRQSPQHRD
jgi:type I restriction-modification system DNA methylase subunit